MTNYVVNLSDGFSLVDVSNSIEAYSEAANLVADMLTQYGLPNVYLLMNVKSIDVIRAMNSYVVYKLNDSVEPVGYGGKQEIVKTLVEVDVRNTADLSVSTVINNITMAILGYNYVNKTINGDKIGWLIMKDSNNITNERGEVWIELKIEVATLRNV